MARRGSALEDLMHVGASLPWKVSLGLAVTTFIVLHLIHAHFAEPVHATDVGMLGVVARDGLIATLTLFFQYIVPAALCVGTLVSAARRRQAIGLFSRVTTYGPSALASMSWFEFEQLIGEFFRRDGYAVVQSHSATADGGVDIHLERNSGHYLVQCKHWRSKSVGAPVVRELYGLMTARGASGCFVVTSGRFSSEARTFASGLPIELIDGERLKEMFARRRDQKACSKEHGESKASIQQTESKAVVTPSCPTCGTRMVLRTARRGAKAGGRFWGCARFPQCRGVVDAA